MATAAGLTEAVLYDALVNYLVSMARTVESAMNRALDAIVGFANPRTAGLPGEVFLLEPRINEMEIMIDEHAIRLLRRGSFSDDEMRLIVASLKITNDLERIGDIAVNLAERVISLREMRYRDQIFENLLQNMMQNVALVSPGLQFVLATRHLERIADHATNIAEDIIFWVRGLDVRHGRGLVVRAEPEPTSPVPGPTVTENSHGLHPQVTPGCETPNV